jgi:hypothetical protein
MKWTEFKGHQPDLAQLGEERFDRTGLVLLATLRRDGWPRVSPVEHIFAGDELYLGMMWRSTKALDLLRDPRCSLHNAVSDTAGGQGEFKVYGKAVEVKDSAERRRFSDACFEKMKFRPEDLGAYHLFSIDVSSAAAATLHQGQWVRDVWKSRKDS